MYIYIVSFIYLFSILHLQPYHTILGVFIITDDTLQLITRFDPDAGHKTNRDKCVLKGQGLASWFCDTCDEKTHGYREIGGVRILCNWCECPAPDDVQRKWRVE